LREYVALIVVGLVVDLIISVKAPLGADQVPFDAFPASTVIELLEQTV
jgi:hypothetical protein